ncbi:hypothetical protein [Streptomyces sp. 058-1L]|uniref:hypothetical protein n=1 Tax=Streptomyces sp. 058-1L TaxID=2789266 RepID=UPI0039817660
MAVQLPVLARAFAHPSPDVQERAFVVAAKYRDGLTAPLLELLGAAAEHTVSALRPRIAEAFGVPLTDPAVPAESEVLPSVTAPRRLVPSADELAEAVERISVWLRGRSQEPAHWERALDDRSVMPTRSQRNSPERSYPC